MYCRWNSTFFQTRQGLEFLRKSRDDLKKILYNCTKNPIIFENWPWPKVVLNALKLKAKGSLQKPGSGLMYIYTTAAGGSVLVVWIEPRIRSVSLSIHILNRLKVGLLMHDILQTYCTKVPYENLWLIFSDVQVNICQTKNSKFIYLLALLVRRDYGTM